jgi:hypothetical protein
MSCASKRPLLQLQLEALSLLWYHQWQVKEAERLRFELKIYLQVTKYKTELIDLASQFTTLIEKLNKNPDTVTAKDWDDIAHGSEKKVQVILGKDHPRNKWPESVPYLNIAALRIHLDQENAALRLLREWLEERNMLSMQGSLSDTQCADSLSWIERLEKLIGILKNALADEEKVSFKEWEEAAEETDVLDKHPIYSVFMERARKRESDENENYPSRGCRREKSEGKVNSNKS